MIATESTEKSPFVTTPALLDSSSLERVFKLEHKTHFSIKLHVNAIRDQAPTTHFVSLCNNVGFEHIATEITEKRSFDHPTVVRRPSPRTSTNRRIDVILLESERRVLGYMFVTCSIGILYILFADVPLRIVTHCISFLISVMIFESRVQVICTAGCVMAIEGR